MFTVVPLNTSYVSSLSSVTKRIQFGYKTVRGIVFSETYWIPSSFLNASNHSKFSIAATANVQVNYEPQIFDKEQSSDLGWQASILAKVSSCKTSRCMRKLQISIPRNHCQGKTKICCNLTVLCAKWQNIKPIKQKVYNKKGHNSGNFYTMYSFAENFLIQTKQRYLLIDFTHKPFYDCQ